MPNPPNLLPVRIRGLEIREVPDGYVVYDQSADKLHFLNGTAAFVLESCDGATRADALPALVGAAFALPREPVDEVNACLQRLLAEGLVVESVPPQAGG
ncbi:MAG: PqqD family protein [Betaproteobacteria bacterium]